MTHKSVTKWLCALILPGIISTAANAEIIYQDNFDTVGVETVPFWPRFGAPDPNADWITIYQNLASRTTNVEKGDGSLVIKTEAKNSGVVSHVSDVFNFFNQELTYTFDGINIEILGESHLAEQWVKFGVVANSNKDVWPSFPLFLVSYSGVGQFSFQVKQPLVGAPGFDVEPRKDFRSRIFNFDVSKLSKVQLTMDSVNYRVVFVFETELDQLSFAGPHNLNRDLWFIDRAELGLTGARNALATGESAVSIRQGQLETAQASGIQADIDAAQAALDSAVASRDNLQQVYDAKLIEAEAFKGDSALMITASSDVQSLYNSATAEQRATLDSTENGARVTINSVTVETTNVLQNF